jgi:acetyl-CoA carboxylase biotin carboxylase subunit
LGYPIILKASAGGGGRGMRIIKCKDDIARHYKDAAREAKACFNDGSLYVEKYLTQIRHIEIQVLSDGKTVLHLGERDCSIQRRNQKLLEESPSPVLDSAIRAQMGEAAVRLCRHVGYENAGTIEFIFDEGSGKFYFMEMNTRIQVEHPVTEAITGIDIVKQQLRIAQGEALDIKQSDIEFRGHAIECRINAEDPDNNFFPCPGAIQSFYAPGGPGIRVDSHLYSGYVIPPFYDSLLGKIIAWGNTREEAIARMLRALSELRVEGVKTTAGFHRKLLVNEQFRRGHVYTTFVEEILQEKR